MTPESIFDMMLQGPVICVACSENGAKIAAGDRNGRLTLADRGGNQNWVKEGVIPREPKAVVAVDWLKNYQKKILNKIA